MFSIIFDMDGVIVDNNFYHRKAWEEFCKRYGFSLSKDEFTQYIFGRINKEVLKFLFKKELTSTEIEKYADEKEIIYRKIYEPFIQLPAGLWELLQELKSNNIKIAIATSAPKSNINFVFNNLGIKDIFNFIIDESKVIHGKPDPEIYLLASQALGTNSQSCIVIEDSVSGIKAAKNAGMKVIAITTTHNEQELRESDFIINSFNELSYNVLSRLDNLI